MSRYLWMLIAGLLIVPSAWAANVEYQGAGGSLAVAGDWYVITNANNPASRTGVTRLPVKYNGTYPSGTPGDLAIIRNGTTTTLAGGATLNAQHMTIGGPIITGQPTGPATTVYVSSGGTLSLYSDEPTIDEMDPQELRFNIGQAYPATLNVNGGFVHVNPRRGGGINVGTSSTGTGVVNLSSGTMTIQMPAVGDPLLAIGFAGGNGRFNQTGGSLLVVGDTGGSTTNMRLGSGGYGQVDISGGLFQVDSVSRIGHEYVDPNLVLPDVPGTGVLTITGGTFEYGYRVIVGDGNRGDANVGHIRLLGGTVMSNPSIDPSFASHLWVGRGQADTAFAGAIGKMTVSQNVVIRSNGLLLGRDGYDAANSQTEVKINSYNNFDAQYAVMLILTGTFEVSLSDGFRPALGTRWKLATTGATSSWFWFDILKMTPGFHLEKNTTELFLVCDALMHQGDANNDGAVNVGDLGILAANWQQATVLGKSWDQGDFTGDDIVNVGDLGVLAANWGWTGAPAGPNAPEPASLLVLLLGSAILRRRR